MKKILVLIIITLIAFPAYAVIPKQNLPQGTFRKKRDGTIVQYNDKGKKIGTYKLENGKYRKQK